VSIGGVSHTINSAKVNMMLIITALAALTVGFLAGLLSLRMKSRWCAHCGANLTCVDCLFRSQEVNSGSPRARH
jgi:hypothetical protein